MSSAPVLLLVEDEPILREVIDMELDDVGFGVVSAADGRKAMTELESTPGRFRAVVTDIRLGPGPDGWEIARRARQLDPKVPVIYISGDSAGSWSAKGVPRSVMLAKPFALSELVVSLSNLMNEVG